MNRFLTLMLMSSLVFAQGWAQTTFNVDMTCAPDFDFGEAAFGTSPEAGGAFSSGVEGSFYYDIWHFIVPASAAGIDSTYPPSLPIDSLIFLQNAVDGNGLLSGVVFTDLATNEAFHPEEIGLEVLDNYGDSPNENTFLGGNQYCAAFQGVPIRAGQYNVTIDAQAWATIFTPFNAPLTFQYQMLVDSILLGCMDMMACNFNAEATEDDGSCTYPEPLYDCNGNCLNDTDGDGICEEVPGCTDETACDYNPVATEDDMSCTYAEQYLDCDGNCLMDTDGDGVCDELEVPGCTDESACNYDDAATDDDGSCTFAADYYDCDGACLNDEDMDGVCDELEVAGCTNVYACNYEETATDDDGSCFSIGDACDDGDEATVNDAIDANCDCVGEVVDGVEALLLADMALFPNPASEVLHVVLPSGASYHLTLFSVSGKRTVATQQTATGQVAWDVAHLPAGAYLLQVRGEAGQVVRQVMLGAR